MNHIARARVLEKLLPASSRRKDSNEKQQKPPSFAQMWKGELMASFRKLPKKYHAYSFEVWSFADGTVFDEITKPCLVWDGVQSNRLCIQDLAGKHGQLPQPTEDNYVERGSIVAEIMIDVLISSWNHIGNGFFTFQCSHPHHIIKAALWDVVCKDDGFKKFNKDDLWDTA